MTTIVILFMASLAGIALMGFWVKKLYYKLDKAQSIIDNLEGNVTHDPSKRKNKV